MRARFIDPSGARVAEIPRDPRIALTVRRVGCANGHREDGGSPRQTVLSPGNPTTRRCADWEEPSTPPCLACLRASVATRARSSRTGITAARSPSASAALPLELLRWILPTAVGQGPPPSIVALNAGDGVATSAEVFKPLNGAASGSVGG